MWSILFITLPTQPTAVRVRVWRALKALGCPALRDGAYLLPAARQALFQPLVDEVNEHGGSAMVLGLSPSSDAQRDQLLALFDRSEAYAQWRGEVDVLAQGLGRMGEPDARRRWRALAQGLQDIQLIDYYPGEATRQADAALAALKSALDTHFSQGEPQARPDHGIARLDPRKFQGRRWATRARPWVDRLASAWLIHRFIDPQADFVWLSDVSRLPRGALGFDFEGARFSHVGARVTFEVLLASFGLDSDARLQRLGGVVHYLDAGGIPVPEAAGLEAVLAGLRVLHTNDDGLLAAASAVFDALLAVPTESHPS
ncbi:chromate resistance protein ChrB domain-containing protein [Hydrogenophaga sp. OTU3427]|uniref:chromate resistance protein ChrB domain-containing protein n=1 Tax=Hydrogenophaga sp. OTU3427 TaxID=3043856 RepID=UPI00313DB617